MTILNPQDEVIVPAPYWVSYPEMIKMCYGVPVIVKSEDGRFEPRIQDIANAVTSYTKLIIINSPGGTYAADYINALKALAKRNIKAIYFGHGDPMLSGVRQKLRHSLENAMQSGAAVEEHAENAKRHSA